LGCEPVKSLWHSLLTAGGETKRAGENENVRRCMMQQFRNLFVHVRIAKKARRKKLTDAFRLTIF
jgi:hypothetical protein